ncbi:MAG: hypothetical protein C0478_14355 [Planctomyces sp.]|nr:hypothetical protein [Planctomyces sp.]
MGVDSEGFIHIRGARTHNLRDVSVELPLGRLIGMTGVSGSGKTSLAIDTLFVEGQRRYLETLDPRIRRRLRQQAWADVDEITGLPPTISLASRTMSPGPRATLATLTEIHDLFRVVYLRAGVLHCPSCGLPVAQSTHDEILDDLCRLPERTKVMLLAQAEAEKGQSAGETLRRIAQAGYVRARINGVLIDTSEEAPTAGSSTETIVEAVIDRVMIKEGIRGRLAESLDAALRMGHGRCLATIEGQPDRHYATLRYCGPCQRHFSDPHLRTFSHFSAAGACPTCLGLGTVSNSPAHDSPTEPSLCPSCHGSRLGEIARHTFWQDQTLPDWLALSVDAALARMQSVMHAIRGDEMTVAAGAYHSLLQRNLIPDIMARLDALQRLGLGYLTLDRAANTLSGGELTRSRMATIIASGRSGFCFVLDEPSSGLHPADMHRVEEALKCLRDAGNTVVVVEHEASLLSRADWLVELGPGAGLLGGQLLASGPPEEVAAHPLSVIAPYLREVRGVSPKREETTAASSVSSAAHSESRSESPLPVMLSTGPIRLPAIKVRNVDVPGLTLQMGQLVCLTGLSGSGKTTLLMEGILPAIWRAMVDRDDQKWAARRGEAIPPPDESQCVIPEELAGVVMIGQSPPGRGWKSLPITVAGLWDIVRRIYATTRDARLRGFTPARFSPWHPEARCPVCLGQGEVALDLDFLPDLKTTCEECHGERFNPATLAIRFRGKSMGDVLRMDFAEAADFFASFERLARPLQLFRDLGLGYLKLGQPMRTVSTGEAQRIRLATYLTQPEYRGPLCFALDEPTTGLHPADVARLLDVLERLARAGHLVLVVEHHLAVIRAADRILDLGPGAGLAGGKLIADGSPDELRDIPTSLTGQALRGRSS